MTAAVWVFEGNCCSRCQAVNPILRRALKALRQNPNALFTDTHTEGKLPITLVLASLLYFVLLLIALHLSPTHKVSFSMADRSSLQGQTPSSY